MANLEFFHGYLPWGISNKSPILMNDLIRIGIIVWKNHRR